MMVMVTNHNDDDDNDIFVDDDDDHGSMRSVSFIILIRIGMLISCCFFSRLCVDLPRVF